MGRWLAGLAGVLTLGLAFAPFALAAPGDLDTSFGTVSGGSGKDKCAGHDREKSC